MTVKMYNLIVLHVSSILTNNVLLLIFTVQIYLYASQDKILKDITFKTFYLKNCTDRLSVQMASLFLPATCNNC